MFGLALQMASMAGAAVFGAFVMRRTQTDSNDDDDYYTIEESLHREHTPQVVLQARLEREHVATWISCVRYDTKPSAAQLLFIGRKIGGG